MFDLSGKVALVTGAGQGVGRGIAAALAAQGAMVLVNDLAADRAAAAAAALPNSRPVPFDVTDPSAVVAAIDERPIDILVNNAGVPTSMRVVQFRDMPQEDWARYVDLNLYGSLHCVAAVLDGMCERGWGRIVQISSVAGRTGRRMGISLYGASKSGIEGFVRHLAQEVARSGVTANSIALGLMDNSGDMPAEVARQVPVGRLGSPADVGAAVAYVASDEAAWLTGQTINLNGGSTSL